MLSKIIVASDNTNYFIAKGNFECMHIIRLLSAMRKFDGHFAFILEYTQQSTYSSNNRTIDYAQDLSS
ncbi:hypothetical protein KSS87_014571 [Heliosperma pusillum]|nr:hypothetical protein KSS87_014104 [Heliosperma pusillum]KAH9619877.1 hypothetical protein KSS87_014571 [Heliosperma pusillum]